MHCYGLKVYKAVTIISTSTNYNMNVHEQTGAIHVLSLHLKFVSMLSIPLYFYMSEMRNAWLLILSLYKVVLLLSLK